MRKEYAHTCKFGDCQQPAELTSDESQVVNHFTKSKNSKKEMINKEYAISSHPTVKVNGYCRYHNWFEDKDNCKKRCRNEK